MSRLLNQVFSEHRDNLYFQQMNAKQPSRVKVCRWIIPNSEAWTFDWRNKKKHIFDRRGTLNQSHLYREASGAGLRRPNVRASHMLFTMWLPIALRTSVSSRGRSSRSSERTRDRWVPKFLWIPEHSMHMRAPRFRLAQVGSGREHNKLGCRPDRVYGW